MRLKLPQWSEDFLNPARYKLAYGGRGSAKSWSFARMLLLLAGSQQERILCAREVQKAISDSVKRLLDDQIRLMVQGKLIPPNYFISTKTEITCPATDSLFLFAGLRTNPESTIKSAEGITRCWVEEAHTVSKASLDILIPTVRAENSELWFSFNPRFKTDPIYDSFILNEPPPNSIIRKINFNKNPWFPKVLQEEMLWDRKRDFDKYLHVWKGMPVQYSEAQVYNGVWKEEPVPEPPEDTTFFYGGDWGFANDPAALLRCWIDPDNKKRLYIDHEAYGLRVEIDELPQFFGSIEGSKKWTIRADPSRPDTISYLNKRGFKIVKAKAGKGSVEDGIAYVRTFDLIVDPRCKHTIDELTLYSYKQDPQTNEILPIVVDKNNHLMDCLRYALSERRMAEKRHITAAGPASIPNTRQLVPDREAA